MYKTQQLEVKADFDQKLQKYKENKEHLIELEEAKAIKARSQRVLKEDSKPKLNKFLRNKLKKITDPTEKQRVIDEYHSSKRVKISETQEKFKLDNKPQEGRSELWDKSE